MATESIPPMLANLFRWLRDLVTGTSPEQRLVILRLLATKPACTQQIVLECAAMGECDDVRGVLRTLRRMTDGGYVAQTVESGSPGQANRVRSQYWITEAGRDLLAGEDEGTVES